MIRFLCKKLIQLRRSGGSKTPLCFLQNPYLIRSITSSSSTNQHSFTVSYLINSCGLSEEKAISASKKVHFKTSNRPNSVLTLFRNNGFTNIHISNIVAKYPLLLLASPEKILKPKIEFFHSIGISVPEVANLLSSQPNVLRISLKNQLIHSFRFLKSFIKSDEDIISAIKRSTRVLIHDRAKQMESNISVLQEHGVPESNISFLIKSQPRALLQKADRFNNIVNKVKEMEFDCSKHAFVSAIQGMTSMNDLLWEEKWLAYVRLGWSDDEILLAFKKQPSCMRTSTKKLMKIMDFLVNKMGYEPSFIASHPTILTFSLEKRIIPRCLIIQVLLSKGLVRKDLAITTVLTMNETIFLKKFVTKYQEVVPELLKVYYGEMACPVLPIKFEEVGEFKML